MSRLGRTTYTKNVVAEDVETKDLQSTGTIKWTTFDPPLSDGGVNNLATTLAAGNSANNQDITDVKDLTCATLNYTTLNPAPAVTSTLAQIMINGNSTGSNNLDMNNNSITNVQNVSANVGTFATLNYSSINPPIVTPTLGQVLTAGNTAIADSVDISTNRIYSPINSCGKDGNSSSN